ncbi:unnamed protein product [Pylaiella littoralis]
MNSMSAIKSRLPQQANPFLPPDHSPERDIPQQQEVRPDACVCTPFTWKE